MVNPSENVAGDRESGDTGERCWFELRRDGLDGEKAGDNVAREHWTYSAGSYSLMSVEYTGICIGRHPLEVLRALRGRGDVGTVYALKGPSLFVCHESSARGSTAVPVLMKGPLFERLDRLFDIGAEAWG